MTVEFAFSLPFFQFGAAEIIFTDGDISRTKLLKSLILLTISQAFRYDASLTPKCKMILQDFWQVVGYDDFDNLQFWLQENSKLSIFTQRTLYVLPQFR